MYFPESVPVHLFTGSIAKKEAFQKGWNTERIQLRFHDPYFDEELGKQLVRESLANDHASIHPAIYAIGIATYKANEGSNWLKLRKRAQSGNCIHSFGLMPEIDEELISHYVLGVDTVQVLLGDDNAYSVGSQCMEKPAAIGDLIGENGWIRTYRGKTTQIVTALTVHRLPSVFYPKSATSSVVAIAELRFNKDLRVEDFAKWLETPQNLNSSMQVAGGVPLVSGRHFYDQNAPLEVSIFELGNRDRLQVTVYPRMAEVSDEDLNRSVYGAYPVVWRQLLQNLASQNLTNS